jgi:hypothetical protein
MQHLFRPLLLAGLAALAVSAAQAQSAGTPAASAPPLTASASAPAAGARPGSRPDQAIERIRVEDAGSRIDELRVGGQTRNITVQPKAAVPAYQVRPEDAAGATADDARSGKGSTSWNVLKF